MNKINIACLIDDTMFTYLLSKQMKLINFCDTVLIFHDGLEALKYLQPMVESADILPSVILLDLNMPVLDGWQFLGEFIKFKPAKKITIYIVSSPINEEDHIKAAGYREVSRFFVKPVSKEDLLDMLTKVG